ncbi:unnamed protein product [Peniophora sp. CBMAI 1063]|nr:unnamed protein product [Peniophora sp. CBMAI 1063]
MRAHLLRIEAEAEAPARNATSRQHIPDEDVFRLIQLARDLKALAPETYNPRDFRAIMDALLDLFIAHRHNETMTTALLALFISFMDRNAAAAYEAAHSTRASNMSTRSPRAIRATVQSLDREIEGLEGALSALRAGQRVLTRRRQDLGGRLVAAREELAQAKSELRRIRTSSFSTRSTGANAAVEVLGEFSESESSRRPPFEVRGPARTGGSLRLA